MFTHKEYIIEIYKEGSFSKAAKNLYISQPSLSATVKRLEYKLGTPLFDRSVSPVKLTQTGQEYIKTAYELKNAETGFSTYLSDMQNLIMGNLAIGGSNLYSSYVLPSMISRYQSLYPSVHIDIMEDNTVPLFEMLETGKIDILLDNADVNDPSLIRSKIADEYIFLAVPKSYKINSTLENYVIDQHKIAEAPIDYNVLPSVDLSFFREMPFIFLKSENDTGERAGKICKNASFTPRVLFRLDQQMTAFNICTSGMGISFVSDTLIRHLYSQPNVLYYKLASPTAHREIFFYMKKKKYLSHAAKAFLESTKQFHM